MKGVKHIIIKLFILLISVYFLDGGRSFLLVTNNIQIILNHNNSNDFEVPHQHHIVNLNNDEKWLESFKFDFSCFSLYPLIFSFNQSTASQDFSDTIWQPPKFV
jgi:hypothetical protein